MFNEQESLKQLHPFVIACRVNLYTPSTDLMEKALEQASELNIYLPSYFHFHSIKFSLFHHVIRSHFGSRRRGRLGGAAQESGMCRPAAEHLQP